MFLNNNLQRSVKLKYLQKKLDNVEQDIDRHYKDLNSCEVGLRQSKQLRDSLIDKMMDLEVKINEELETI